MTIRSVDVRVVKLDNQTLATSYGANVTQREHVFVSITNEDGTTGYGEGSPLPHFSGERAREMRVVIEEVLGPVLVGLDPFDTEQAQQALDHGFPHHSASKAALISALFDLQGKLAGLPVHALLAGKLKDSVQVGGAVGITDDAAVLARVDELWQRGIRTVKFKIGADVNRDIAVIRLLRERLPPELEIRADANAGFSFSQAQRFIGAVGDCRLQYLEQPLAPHDWKGLRRLRGEGTPIAVDESLFGLHDAFGLLAEDAADVFIIKLIKVGGLHQARKIVGLAEAAGVSCVVVSPYETALGVAANLHLAAGSTAFDLAAELGVGVSAVQLPGSGEVVVENGAALLPTGPGLGITMPSFAAQDT